MHHQAIKMARPGLVERDLVAAMTEICLREGGRPAFPMIVTVKGHVLHNHDHDGLLKAGDMIVNDSGAESPGHYAGDISRTIPVTGRFDTRQLEIYGIILNAQAQALAAIRPGVPFLDMHLLACRTLTRGLMDLGIMKGDPDEAVAAGAHALFFQCGLGHMMGLDAHDMEDLGEDFVGYGPDCHRSSQFGLKSLRLARPLETGFVLTVEPGLYFIPELIDLWKSDHRCSQFIDYRAVENFRNFTGARVEDNVLVTDSGVRVLGEPIAKKPEEIEALR
jgi:Xaa-Pro aminopeptidase